MNEEFSGTETFSGIPDNDTDNAAENTAAEEGQAAYTADNADVNSGSAASGSIYEDLQKGSAAQTEPAPQTGNEDDSIFAEKNFSPYPDGMGMPFAQQPRPPYGQAGAFGQPVYGQQAAYGQPTVYGQPPYQPMNSGYGQPNAYGQPMSGAYGHPNAYGQPMNSAYGQQGIPPYQPMNGGYGQPTGYARQSIYADPNMPEDNAAQKVQTDTAQVASGGNNAQPQEQSAAASEAAEGGQGINTAPNAQGQQYRNYVPFGSPYEAGQRRYFPEAPKTPFIKAEGGEEAVKKKPKTGLLVFMFLILLAGLCTVMVILAISDREKKDDLSSDTLSSSGESVNVTINVQHRDVKDKSDYADESTGLFTVPGAVKYVMPSIVSVHGYTDTTVISNISASGVIMSDDGYIITNAHVVEELKRVTVELSDEREFEAQIIGFDKNTDLAVLKIKADDLVPAVLGSTQDLSQGDTVISIGNSGGFSNTVTTGCVSYIDREVNSYNGYPVKCVQTDAALNSGVSGGALIDLYGRVVGITTSKYTAENSDRLGFAISIDFAAPVLEDIIEKGYVTGRPRIGIMYNFISPQNANDYDLRPGLLVREISDDCDIANTDLKVDDIITEIDGKVINTEDAIKQIQSTHKPGDRVKAKVYRKGTFEEEGSSEFEIEFTFSEFEE